jgi:hypothetical protein
MHKTSPNRTNTQQSNDENVKWNSECHTIWKFLLIHSLASNNSIKIRDNTNRHRKPFIKEEHERKVSTIIQIMKN